MDLQIKRVSRWKCLANWAVLCYLQSQRPICGQQRRTVGFRLKDRRQICVLCVKLDLFFQGRNKCKAFYNNVFREIFGCNSLEVINTYNPESTV